MKISLFNTLTRQKEEFKPIKPDRAGIYCCGPTVYNFAHIGNLRAYCVEDWLKRTLLLNGYSVYHVMNITDVGHLESDDDVGEDKMEVGSLREGKTAWEIAEHYISSFRNDMIAMNILPPDVYCRATEHIDEQIRLVACLEEKGYIYKTSDGVYFDTSKFPSYGELARLDIKGLEEGKRIVFSDEKRNKTDFALWKFSPEGSKRQMEWDSPWGRGFPGWHIECSAMSMKYLGETIDIHCGGIDHIPVHHTNEIAQSESCTGKKFVNYWFHNEFLIMEAEKMSKSAGDFIRLQTVLDKGFEPLDLRYFLMMTHYRKKINFSWETLESAQNAHQRLKNRIIEFKEDQSDPPVKADSPESYRRKFAEVLNDDINTPEALAVLWTVVRDEDLSSKQKLGLVIEFDRVLGLRLAEQKDREQEAIPEDVLMLVEQRSEAKKKKDFKLADSIRKQVRDMGYDIVDKKEGVEVKKI